MKRLGGVLLIVVVLIAGGFGLLQIVVARDDADVATPESGPGQAANSQCPSGELPALTRDRRELTEDQRASILALGNVILQGPEPGALAPVQRRVSGPFDPEFVLAGQMVVIEPSPDGKVHALAWERELVAGAPDDPAVEEFTSTYLGQGAEGACD